MSLRGLGRNRDMKPYEVRIADWETDREAIQRLRTTVFVEEQEVPSELEWDGLDSECVHALAIDSKGTAIATGRMQAGGKIGRMAVRKDWRGKAVGSAILGALVAEARRRGLAEVTLASQAHAVPFYERHGFRSVGEHHIEAGIPHQRMALEL